MKRIQIVLAVAALAVVTMQSCSKKEQGCTDSLACNFDSGAEENDGSCVYGETYYQDADGDGLGNANISRVECEQPAGYVTNSTDVNDVPGSGNGGNGGGGALTFSRTAVPIIFKITGETCYYCGDWGWQAWIDLANDFHGKAFAWSNFGAGFSDRNFRDQELDNVNTVADAMEDMFEDGGGKPNFATNGVDYSTSANDAKNAANSALSVTPDVAGAFTASIDGNTLTLKAGAKFYTSATGEYWMGAYVIEDKAMGPQSGPIGNAGDVEHHLVMRGSMSASPWGVELTASGASADQVIEKTFTATLPASYDQANLSYGVIIWKKDGSNYAYVNAYTNQ